VYLDVGGAPFEERKDLQLLPFKGAAVVGASLGLLALSMAVVGLYGAMAFVVSQRVREIGIRAALGATAQNIVGLFVRQGMRLVAIGLALGSVGGVVVAIVLSKIVVGAQSFDPLACGAGALLIAIVTLFACWLPARRAAKVDPMIALRAE
jgi:ABC-type antimicrobial peptide transport system permease subunit